MDSSDDDERDVGGKQRRVLPMAIEGPSTSGLRVSFLIARRCRWCCLH